MIPIAKPLIGEEEIKAVTEVLKSGMLAQGKEVEAFEREFASYIGVKNAIAVCNGTVALDLALKALKIKSGDEVITTPFTFIASANAILYQGARPIFADIDERTYNLDPEKALEKINPRTKAILVVHLYGQPCDMKAFKEICEDHKLLLIEDCAQAHGAEFEGKKVGSFGDVATFSFYPTKNMTTAEGGMILTNDDEIAKKLRILRDQGQTRKYWHEELGYNYRMTNVAAAIGRVQLKKLEKWNEIRRRNAELLGNGLKKIDGLNPPFVDRRAKHVFHQFVVRIESDQLSREELMKRLKERGIETAVHYPLPVHHQPIYQKLGYPKEICPRAIDAAKRVLSIPVHPALSEEDIAYIVRSLEDVFR